MYSTYLFNVGCQERGYQSLQWCFWIFSNRCLNAQIIHDSKLNCTDAPKMWLCASKHPWYKAIDTCAAKIEEYRATQIYIIPYIKHTHTWKRGNQTWSLTYLLCVWSPMHGMLSEAGARSKHMYCNLFDLVYVVSILLILLYWSAVSEFLHLV